MYYYHQNQYYGSNLAIYYKHCVVCSPFTSLRLDLSSAFTSLRLKLRPPDYEPLPAASGS